MVLPVSTLAEVELSVSTFAEMELPVSTFAEMELSVSTILIWSIEESFNFSPWRDVLLCIFWGRFDFTCERFYELLFLSSETVNSEVRNDFI